MAPSVTGSVYYVFLCIFSVSTSMPDLADTGLICTVNKIFSVTCPESGFCIDLVLDLYIFIRFTIKHKTTPNSYPWLGLEIHHDSTVFVCIIMIITGQVQIVPSVN